MSLLTDTFLFYHKPELRLSFAQFHHLKRINNAWWAICELLSVTINCLFIEVFRSVFIISKNYIQFIVSPSPGASESLL